MKNNLLFGPLKTKALVTLFLDRPYWYICIEFICI